MVLRLILFLLFCGLAHADSDVSIDGYDYTEAEMLEFDGIMGSPSVSTVGKAKVYFDSTLGKLQCSEDGGAYGDCVGASSSPGSSGPWGSTTGQVYPITITDNVGIGTFVANAELDISSTAANDLFRLNDNGTGDTTPFIIDANGNVGIGTAFSTVKMNVFNPAGTSSVLRATNGADAVTGGFFNSYAYEWLANTTSGSAVGASRFHMQENNVARKIATFSGQSDPFALDIGSNGNIGIGTNAPASLVHISSTDGNDLFRVDDNGVGDTTPTIINLDGNVGINTTTAPAPLVIGARTFEVNSVGTIARIGSNANSSISGAAIQLTSTNVTFNNGSSNSGANVLITGSNATNGFLDLRSTSGVGSGDHVKFRVGNAGATEAMRIVTSGNVGIGTFSPLSLLTLEHVAVAANSTGFRIRNGSSGQSFVQDVGIASTNETSFGIRNVNLATYPLVISSADNVGISSITPGTKLDVTGAIRLTGTDNFIQNGNWLSGDGGDEGVAVSSTGNVAIGDVASYQGGSLGLQIRNSAATPGFFMAANTFTNPATSSFTGDNVFLHQTAISSSDGGVQMVGVSDGDVAGLRLRGVSGTTGGLNTSNAPVQIMGGKLSGSSATNVGATDTLMSVVQNDATPLFAITGNGNTGIGPDEAPDQFFDVQGNANFDGNVGIGSLAPGMKLDIQGEIRVSGVTGSGKAICVKSTGDFGVCGDAVGAGGTCTCS